MRSYLIAIVTSILLLISFGITGYGASEGQTAHRIITLENDEFRKERAAGFNALYNMDYQTARSHFARLAQVSPEHPAGYFYLATNYWLELLNSTRRLQSNLYNSDSFYAETQDKVDARIDREFKGLADAALKRAENAVKVNSRDPEAIYYQGAIHGLIASYEATVTRSFLSALRNGNKAMDLHKKVVEIEPTFWDAYLTIGTYDYIVGSLPLPVKVIAAIGGFRGSRNRGLEELHLVTERGKYASDDARVVLLALYGREKRYDDILKTLDSLSGKYPQNYLFKIERANALVKLGRSKESNAIFEELLKSKEATKVNDLVQFQYGDVLVKQGRKDEALKHFLAVTSISDAHPQLVTRAHLRIGQLYDQLSRRQEAVTEYQQVLQRENVFDSHDQAKKYIKKPYVAPTQDKEQG